jgi:hypothetical protein
LIFERHTDGDLGVFLAERRKAGESFERIARYVSLMTDGEIAVSASTIRNWLSERSVA